MSVAVILALIDGALTLLEKFSPVVKELFANGDITPEQQQKINNRVNALRKSEAFAGPEWEA